MTPAEIKKLARTITVADMMKLVSAYSEAHPYEESLAFVSCDNLEGTESIHSNSAIYIHQGEHVPGLVMSLLESIFSAAQKSNAPDMAGRIQILFRVAGAILEAGPVQQGAPN